MNQDLKTILDFIQQSEHVSEEEKTTLIKAAKDADKALTISEFKLERTEKVKRTTAILLEETIEELEQKQKSIEESNKALTDSLAELKAAQAQLIQAEKMASLGELTAGIAHEIQNPLNFVNNFSDVSKELLEEMLEELKNGDIEEVNAIANDVIQNLEKILHHGKRADGIVKGMLQHSRTSKGEKEVTDMNVLVDEYLRLAYHGLRAKDKTFNATLETAYDATIGKAQIVPQDIGRVVLNLITNAFYACTEKKKVPLAPEGGKAFEAKVIVSTKRISPLRLASDEGGTTERNALGGIEISVKDNGNGIPATVLEKIFQPFFTTKPTGQGTGLGLSLSYDIVKAHGGELKVQTKEGEGTEFIISLPITN
ncbi:sensor histidine kinase [Rasiella sp. SM2506]|uniref:sensor histidine kinase n=1 Tax=Rasiella sp. SM2506 TaxID=3423914 RepID=UPI003D791DE1